MSHPLKTYNCPWCKADHVETALPNRMPILDGHCSANHRWPLNVGNWRVCHATFDAMGGPNRVGTASLCNPCHDKLFAPALAMQKALLDDLEKRTGARLR